MAEVLFRILQQDENDSIGNVRFRIPSGLSRAALLHQLGRGFLFLLPSATTRSNPSPFVFSACCCASIKQANQRRHTRNRHEGSSQPIAMMDDDEDGELKDNTPMLWREELEDTGQARNNHHSARPQGSIFSRDMRMSNHMSKSLAPPQVRSRAVAKAASSTARHYLTGRRDSCR